MTVSTTDVQSGPYTPNGVTVDFPFTFKVESTSEVEVVAVDGDAETVVSSALYDVELDGQGGTVTFDTAPLLAIGVLYIRSNPDFTQEEVFSREGNFSPATLNPSFDRSAQRDLWLKARIDRLLPDGAMSPGLGAGTFIGRDAQGNPAFLSGTGNDSALRTDLATAGGSDLVDFTSMTGPIAATYDASAEIATAGGHWHLTAVAVGVHRDGLLSNLTVSGAGGIGYPFHGVVTIGADVLSGNAAGGGFAAGGAGPGSGVVGNRGGAGIGYGGIFTREDSGDGYGMVATFQGTGTGGGAWIVKQTTTGLPGGSSGTGPALRVENTSASGQGIIASTGADNDEAISHILERLNPDGGFVGVIRDNTAGALTTALTALTVQHIPSGNRTGTAAVTGVDIQIGANQKTSGQVTGLQIVDHSVNAAGSHFGADIAVDGANSVNRAMRLSATGASLNIALETTGHIKAAGLPTYADEAAAVTGGLAQNSLYKTAAGEIRIKL